MKEISTFDAAQYSAVKDNGYSLVEVNGRLKRVPLNQFTNEDTTTITASSIIEKLNSAETKTPLDAEYLTNVNVLPDVSAEDAGKHLIVGQDGAWTAAEYTQSDLPEVTEEDNNKVLQVVDGEWKQQNYRLASESTLGAVKIGEGLIVDEYGTISVQQSISTNVVSEQVLKQYTLDNKTAVEEVAISNDELLPQTTMKIITWDSGTNSDNIIVFPYKVNNDDTISLRGAIEVNINGNAIEDISFDSADIDLDDGSINILAEDADENTVAISIGLDTYYNNTYIPEDDSNETEYNCAIIKSISFSTDIQAVSSVEINLNAIKQTVDKLDSYLLNTDESIEVKNNKLSVVQHTADFDENDQTSLNYIANRTHWKTGGNITYTEEDLNLIYGSVYTLHINNKLNICDTIDIQINNQDYRITFIDSATINPDMQSSAAYTIDNVAGIVVINDEIKTSYNEDGIECELYDLCIYSMSGPITQFKYIESNLEYHKLDSNYLNIGDGLSIKEGKLFVDNEIPDGGNNGDVLTLVAPEFPVSVDNKTYTFAESYTAEDIQAIYDEGLYIDVNTGDFGNMVSAFMQVGSEDADLDTDDKSHACYGCVYGGVLQMFVKIDGVFTTFMYLCKNTADDGILQDIGGLDENAQDGWYIIDDNSDATPADAPTITIVNNSIYRSIFEVATPKVLQTLFGGAPSIEWKALNIESTNNNATPDWSAAEDEDGYIANRTHYDDEKFITFTEENSTLIYGTYIIPCSIIKQDDDTISITINDTQYSDIELHAESFGETSVLTGTTSDNKYGVTYVTKSYADYVKSTNGPNVNEGNLIINAISPSDNIESFVFYAESHEIKQLDSKYIKLGNNLKVDSDGAIQATFDNSKDMRAGEYLQDLYVAGQTHYDRGPDNNQSDQLSYLGGIQSIDFPGQFINKSWTLLKQVSYPNAPDSQNKTDFNLYEYTDDALKYITTQDIKAAITTDTNNSTTYYSLVSQQLQICDNDWFKINIIDESNSNYGKSFYFKLYEEKRTDLRPNSGVYYDYARYDYKILVYADKNLDLTKFIGISVGNGKRFGIKKLVPALLPLGKSFRERWLTTSNYAVLEAVSDYNATYSDPGFIRNKTHFDDISLDFSDYSSSDNTLSFSSYVDTNELTLIQQLVKSKQVDLSIIESACNAGGYAVFDRTVLSNTKFTFDIDPDKCSTTAICYTGSNSDNTKQIIIKIPTYAHYTNKIVTIQIVDSELIQYYANDVGSYNYPNEILKRKNIHLKLNGTYQLDNKYINTNVSCETKQLSAIGTTDATDTVEITDSSSTKYKVTFQNPIASYSAIELEVIYNDGTSDKKYLNTSLFTSDYYTEYSDTDFTFEISKIESSESADLYITLKNQVYIDSTIKINAIKSYNNTKLNSEQFQIDSNNIISLNTSSIVVDSLPEVTEADNGKMLKVVNGVWTAVEEPTTLKIGNTTVTEDQLKALLALLETDK